MCVDPVTLTVISTAVGVAGSLQAASAQSAAAKASAAQARQQAQEVENKTTFDLDAAARRFAQQQGAAKSFIATSGLDPSSFGSALDDDAKQAALERTAIRTSGSNQIAGLLTSANSSDAQAKSAKTAGYINAASAVVNGATTYAKLKNPQTFKGNNEDWGGISFNSVFSR